MFGCPWKWGGPCMLGEAASNESSAQCSSDVPPKPQTCEHPLCPVAQDHCCRAAVPTMGGASNGAPAPFHTWRASGSSSSHLCYPSEKGLANCSGTGYTSPNMFLGLGTHLFTKVQVRTCVIIPDCSERPPISLLGSVPFSAVTLKVAELLLLLGM